MVIGIPIGSKETLLGKFTHCALSQVSSFCHSLSLIFHSFTNTYTVILNSKRFPVSPIPGISINSLWILSLRSIQINPITPTALSSASIVANAHTNPSFDFGLLQFDTLITYILLTSERVAGIVSVLDYHLFDFSIN